MHHQYSSSVSPFHANTGMPFGFCGVPPFPADDDRGGGVILRREDVARDPAHVRAELGQRLDEDGRLNRHVQAAHDPGAGERLARRVLLADATSGRAFPARRGASPCGRTRPGARSRDLVRIPAGRLGGLERVLFLLDHGCHCSYSPFSASPPVATNKPGPLARASGASGTTAVLPNPASLNSRLIVLLREPEPDVAHLLAIAVAIVRQHVDDDERGRRA